MMRLTVLTHVQLDVRKHSGSQPKPTASIALDFDSKMKRSLAVAYPERG